MSTNYEGPPPVALTVDVVRSRVASIAKIGGDPECAHSSEDTLRDDVLEAIAAGAPNAQELAREALKTNDLTFPRWCA